MVKNILLTIVRHAGVMINHAVLVVTNIQYSIKERQAKLLSDIVDKFEEYSDYLTETNDTIKNAFDKLKDVFSGLKDSGKFHL